MNDSGDERSTRIKRVRTSAPPEPRTRKTLTHHDYTAAWICPLEVELIAALEMLDEEHERLSQPRPPLFHAVNVCNVAAVNFLLQNGADPNIHGNESSPLDFAVAFEMADMVDLLLTHGANPNIHERDLHWRASGKFRGVGKQTWRLLVKHVVQDEPNAVHDDMFLWAARHGYISLVRVLLEHSTNINIRDPQSGETPLSLAVLKGHCQVAAILVDKGANLELRDSIGRTPLSKAAMEGAEGAVRLLLDRGANPKSRDSVSQTPLFYAIENGNEGVIRALLQKDPTLCDCKDEFGRGPLMLAAEETCRAVLQIIGETRQHREVIFSGLDIVMTTICSSGYELPQRKGQRLLLWAAAHGHLDVIRALMEKDICHLCHDDSRRTPFTLAIEKGQVAVIKHFLHCGLDPNCEDEAGYTPLSWAVHSGDEATIQLLLESGADHNTPIKKVFAEQETLRPRLLFFLAVERGYDRVVELLLQLGVDPNYQPRGLAESGPDSTDEWHNALALAVMKGHFNVVNILLRRNIDSPVRHDALRLAMELTDTPLACLIMQKGIRTNWLLDAYGHELLFQAAFSGCVPVLKGLLDAGTKRQFSDPSCRRRIKVRTIRRSSPTRIQKEAYPCIGDTPLKLAAEEGHLEVVQVLLDNSTNPNAGSPLLGAIRNGHVRVAELLFRHGAQLDTENYGAVLLHVTVARGHLDAVRMLLDMGLDPKIGLDPELELETWKQPDPNKIKGLEKIDLERTYVGPGHLLFEAVARGHVDIAQLLLTRGVDPNVTDKFGQTVFFLAARGGNCTMMLHLLELGCHANATDRLGRTPLFVAAYYRQPEAVRLLLNEGADMQTTTSAGRTPLSVARDLNYPEVVSLLSGQDHQYSKKYYKGLPTCIVMYDKCATCNSRIVLTDPVVKCEICKDHHGKDLIACLECVTMGLPCYDKLHILHKMILDKRCAAVERMWVAVERFSVGRHASSPVHASATRPLFAHFL